MNHFLWIRIAAAIATTVIGLGCSATLPAQYEPQSIVRVDGTSYVGEFEYQYHSDGLVQSNQIKNTAAGTIYIGPDVANFVQRATATEMERSGIVLDEHSNRIVVGRILDLAADDLGYSVDWSYSIEYTILDKREREKKCSKEFTPHFPDNRKIRASI